MGKSPVLGAHAWKRVEGPWRECHLDWAALMGPDRGASALVTRGNLPAHTTGGFWLCATIWRQEGSPLSGPQRGRTHGAALAAQRRLDQHLSRAQQSAESLRLLWQGANSP